MDKKPSSSKPTPRGPESSSEVSSSQDDEDYSIRKLVEKRTLLQIGRKYYYLKWKGYNVAKKENTAGRSLLKRNIATSKRQEILQNNRNMIIQSVDPNSEAGAESSFDENAKLTENIDQE